MNNHTRWYREHHTSGRWECYGVKVETTDLYIRSTANHGNIAEEMVRELRDQVRRHANQRPEFLTAMSPLEEPEGLSPILQRMYRASRAAGVGPMAAVAGAVAELTGEALAEKSDEVIVENGGDIWMRLAEPALISLYAGRSRFSGRFNLKIYPEQTPMGICSSSGRFGHSFSLGRADLVTVTSPSASLADTVATGACNLVSGEDDLQQSVAYAMSVEGVSGILCIYWDTMAMQGDIELCAPESENESI